MPSNTIHSRFAETATRLIDRHGRGILLVTQTNTGTDFDPVLNETTAPVVAVQTKYTNSEINGDLVQQGDRKYLIDSAVAITNDMRIRDGVDYSIVDIDEVKPGNTSIIYKVQARI